MTDEKDAGITPGEICFSPRPNRADLVNWSTWNEEPFRRAEEEGKAVFLSISASWCHVMDETTFSDPEVIRLLNERFVPVRVDTDRHPDINRRYNQGGWPTVAFLDARGNLLAGATYLPSQTVKEVLDS